METAKGFFQNYLKTTAGETIRILPDTLIFMSGFFALLTSSLPQAMLFISLLESVIGFHLLQKISGLFNLTYVLPSERTFSEYCRSGFRSASLSDVSFFGYGGLESGFPSAPLYILSVAIAYIFTSIQNQVKELEALGPEYASRFYISVITLMIVLFVVGSYRMYYSCDSVGVVMLSIFVGFAIGTLLVYQNLKLFGPDSVNLLAIPLLRDRTVNGEKIYACTQRASTF